MKSIVLIIVCTGLVLIWFFRFIVKRKRRHAERLVQEQKEKEFEQKNLEIQKGESLVQIVETKYTELICYLSEKQKDFFSDESLKAIKNSQEVLKNHCLSVEKKNEDLTIQSAERKNEFETSLHKDIEDGKQEADAHRGIDLFDFKKEQIDSTLDTVNLHISKANEFLEKCNSVFSQLPDAFRSLKLKRDNVVLLFSLIKKGVFQKDERIKSILEEFLTSFEEFAEWKAQRELSPFHPLNIYFDSFFLKLEKSLGILDEPHLLARFHALSL